ncbi:MAG: helix-turn-helix domain-containing protein [Deltaproteobacteria bacterium]|nr:helix-turn-helix domain-containing protein [Candidatus Zymogenaceae bacterium]
MYRNFRIHAVSNRIEVIHSKGIDCGTCLHTHSNWVFALVLEGERIIQIGNELFRVQAGRYYLIEPHRPHKVLPGKAVVETMVVTLRERREVPDTLINPGYERYSREYRIRKIKGEYGLPPGRLARQERVKKAQTLLLEGHTQSYAAQEAGFCDQAHFCKCFAALWGVSPGKYLEAAKGD